ncbi:MAG: ankyrin repeat domain-containing protein [Proteobacteria bacterium]|nr:ankyrin repeat domain-containing protein [Pseudomonadota bacterium]
MSSVLNSCRYKLCVLAAILLANLLLLASSSFAFTYSFREPLVDAAHRGDNEQVLELLARGVPVDNRGKLGATALMQAAYHNNTRLIEVLLARGANPDAQDIGGATALHIAVRQGHTEAVRLLLDAAANPNLQDFSGMTPIDYSINLHRTEEAYMLRYTAKVEKSQPAPTETEATQPPPHNSIKYIGDNMPWLDNDSAVPNTPAAQHKEQLKELHSQATHIAAAPISEVQSEKISAPPAEKQYEEHKSKHKIKVHEAIKLPDNYDSNKSQSNFRKKLKELPMLRAEISGGTQKESITYGYMLSTRYPNKRFHNLMTGKGARIYVTPFANSMEAESWCNTVRDFTKKWRCKVALPDQ